MKNCIFSRTEILIGKRHLEKLKMSKVIVVGLGGVGSFTAEALARAGIGGLTLVDGDVIRPSNLNRQIHAFNSTIGLSKVDVMKERILDINPQATVTGIQEFYSIENALKILTGNYDFLVDAIDVISPKIDLIVNCKKASIPMISAMGAGNKLDPTKFNVADISRTSVCPLARKIRKELRRRGIYNGVKVVFSTEIHSNKKRKNNALLNKNSKQVFYRNPIGSISFVPSVMGLIIAGEVVRDLLEIDHTKTI